MCCRYSGLGKGKHVGKDNRAARELGLVNTKESGICLENDRAVAEPKVGMLDQRFWQR
jgi:hypothetical protein